MAASRDEIVSFCDELLEIEGWEDYGPNGLQVPGAASVEVVVSGVSANLELLRAAADAGAQMVISHHGTLWNDAPRAITHALAERLRTLLCAEISLAAYHLPLDAHREIGNNALICEKLGLEQGEPFGEVKGRPIGFVGRAAAPISEPELRARLAELTGREPLAFAEGPAQISTVGIISGGGGPEIEEAAGRGLDAMITGEPEEFAAASARENSLHFMAAGHHATETFGISALGDRIAERFGVEHRFIEVPNPV